MKSKTISIKTILLLLVFFILPIFVFARSEDGGGGSDDIPKSDSVSFITNIPFIKDIGNFSELINALFILTLVLGALLAVVKLVIAGATYMLSDVVIDYEYLSITDFDQSRYY